MRKHFIVLFVSFFFVSDEFHLNGKVLALNVKYHAIGFVNNVTHQLSSSSSSSFCFSLFRYCSNDKIKIYVIAWTAHFGSFRVPRYHSDFQSYSRQISTIYPRLNPHRINIILYSVAFQIEQHQFISSHLSFEYLIIIIINCRISINGLTLVNSSCSFWSNGLELLGAMAIFQFLIIFNWFGCTKCWLKSIDWKWIYRRLTHWPANQGILLV